MVNRAVLIVVIVAAISSQRAAASGHDEEIRQSLIQLERRATIGTQQEGEEKVAAIKVLKQYPTEAIPFVIANVANKNKSLLHRDECLLMLDQQEFVPHLSPAHYDQLLSVVADAQEDRLLRIDAAGIILRNYKNPPQSVRQTIKQSAFDLIKTDQSPALVYELVLAHFPGDADVENRLLGRLKTDQDKNAAILVLGKIRSPRALDEIVQLLQSDQVGKSFYKVRAYIAIGDIGGEKACDLLLQYFEKEPNYLDQDALLVAIGRAKTPRCTKMLLERLKTKGASNLSLLEGIKYSKDMSAVPALQEELAKPRSDSADNAAIKHALTATIDALRKGDDSTYW